MNVKININEKELNFEQKENNVIAFFKAQNHKLLNQGGLYLWAHIYTDEGIYQYSQKNYFDMVGLSDLATKVDQNIYRINFMSDTENLISAGFNVKKDEYKGFRNGENKDCFDIVHPPQHLKTGDIISLSTQGHAIMRDEKNRPTIAVGTYRDISKEIKKDKLIEELTQLAYYDHLTKLPNRKKLWKDYEEDTIKGNYFGFIDLDKFKEINDTYGHEFGDKCLLAFSERVKARLDNDMIENIKIYRMHGDEFCATFSITKEGLEKGLNIEKMMKVLTANIANYVVVDGVAIKMAASIGVIRINRKTNFLTLRQVLKMADEAMYIAKNQPELYHIVDFNKGDYID